MEEHLRDLQEGSDDCCISHMLILKEHPVKEEDIENIRKRAAVCDKNELGFKLASGGRETD